MHNRSTILTFGLILVTLMPALNSCKKETVPGPQGETGDAGKNASVITTTMHVAAGAWSMDSDSIIWSTVVFSPLVTKDVIDKGVVKLSVMRGTTWWDLPLTEDRDILTQFGIEQGQLQFEVVKLHGRAPRPADQEFRMVIIPPQ